MTTTLVTTSSGRHHLCTVTTRGATCFVWWSHGVERREVRPSISPSTPATFATTNYSYAGWRLIKTWPFGVCKVLTRSGTQAVKHEIHVVIISGHVSLQFSSAKTGADFSTSNRIRQSVKTVAESCRVAIPEETTISPSNKSGHFGFVRIRPIGGPGFLVVFPIWGRTAIVGPIVKASSVLTTGVRQPWIVTNACSVVCTTDSRTLIPGITWAAE